MKKTSKSHQQRKIAVYIAGASKKTASALEKAVMNVLNSSAGDDVKKEALRVMANALATTASVTGCNISM